MFHKMFLNSVNLPLDVLQEHPHNFALSEKSNDSTLNSHLNTFANKNMNVMHGGLCGGIPAYQMGAEMNFVAGQICSTRMIVFRADLAQSITGFNMHRHTESFLIFIEAQKFSR